MRAYIEVVYYKKHDEMRAYIESNVRLYLTKNNIIK